MALWVSLSGNFQVQFESSDFSPDELPKLEQRLQELPQAFEADFAILRDWFGIPFGEGFGPENRVIVTLSKTIRGASNNGYSKNNPRMTVNANLGGTFDSVVSLFVAEMIEIFMGYPGKWNWRAGDSGGEGLSRVAADLLHPQSAPKSADNNVNAWLASDPTTDPTAAVADSEFRKDWVSANFTGGPLKAGGNVAGDGDSYSFGCSMLFINYLRDQLGYSMAQIARHGTGTLDGTYRAISHASISGFPQFRRLLEVHFPGPGSKSSSDNPFPLSMTNVAAASAGRQDRLFVFARLLDGRILFNQAGPGEAFAGWQVVPGGVRTVDALAAGMQKDTLFVFARQRNGRIFFNQAAPGGAFVGWQVMPGGVVTNVPPAAAGRRDNLFVFATAPDGRILFNQAAPGGAFVGWQEIPGGVRTDTAVAAGMQKDTLFVFARQRDGRILFNQAGPGGAFVGWQDMPGGVVTDVAPAAAGRHDNLFVFAKTPDGRILFNQAAPGGAFVGWQEVPGGVRTNDALAAGMQKDTLFVFARQPDGRLLFNQAAPGGAFAGWLRGL
jgi:hypothetical protein